MRRRHIALILGLASSGCAANESGCRKDLSEVEITTIVDGYLERTYGSSARWPEKDVKLGRDGCDYVYVEHSTTQPIHVGDWFGMTISQDGDVIHFQPGY